MEKRLFTRAEAADYLARAEDTFDQLVSAGFIKKGYHQASKRPLGERGSPVWKREWLDEYVDKFVIED